MKSVLKPTRSSLPLDSVERILSRYFAQLVEWSRILSRGDKPAAEETVQDLCLHLTVAQPDLSRVQNLDNYLFMCLRNMYVSNLARVSRERLRVIQVEDFDAVGMVAVNGRLDAVDVQNELIRIGDYVLSRKYVSKSASHFILHFFLGYRRRDVALLARSPISAVYNSLKEVRGELREYLSAGDKIRLVRRDGVPEKQLLRTAVATDLLLKELRSAILDADPENCIAEKDLIDSYTQPDDGPVGCRELAHIAGCERCLNILARMLQLDDRDGPLDGIDGDLDRKQNRREANSFEATMRAMRGRREQLLERRPGLLAIAVDGRVVAFHAVESTHNSLSSRVVAESNVRFIEVFNEYGDRLAHIPLDPESSRIPREQLTQQISLSDDRWLRLDVRFDGLGIQAEVDYVDRAVAPMGALKEDARPHTAPTGFWQRFHALEFFRLAPWGRVAFACLLLAGLVGVVGYRYMHPGWRDVLNRAEAVAQIPSATEALHQTLRIEQTVEPEKGSVVGSIDIWRSSDGRAVRHLFNHQEQLLATSIESEEGSGTVRLENEAAFTARDRQLVESGVWRSDVSASAFANIQGSGTAVEASRNLDGFELTQRGNGRDGILSRSLFLNASYDVQAEKVRFQTADGVREVRLVQTLLRRVPNREVPPLTFPQSKPAVPGGESGRSSPSEPGGNRSGDSSGANLEVAVLFELFKEHVDTEQPIEVNPVARGRVRVNGTVADARLLAAIREGMASLPNANHIDFQIYSAFEAAKAAPHGKPLRQELVGSTTDAPAAAVVRDALLARGLKGAALQNAEQEFRASALAHAQTALQHAYALDRLGAILRRNGETALTPAARIMWAQMVERHSTGVMTELQVLRLQLDSVSPGLAENPSIDAHGIADAASFVRTSSNLRAKVQSANEEVVKLFAGNAVDIPAAQARESIVRLRSTLPVTEANRMQLFASRLTNRNPSGQNEMGEMHPH
jgi:DNA-directed RNA polymerase specialized sigma24 family protein